MNHPTMDSQFIRFDVKCGQRKKNPTNDATDSSMVLIYLSTLFVDFPSRVMRFCHSSAQIDVAKQLQVRRCAAMTLWFIEMIKHKMYRMSEKCHCWMWNCLSFCSLRWNWSEKWFVILKFPFFSFYKDSKTIAWPRRNILKNSTFFFLTPSLFFSRNFFFLETFFPHK